jgi:hypothetical protein
VTLVERRCILLVLADEVVLYRRHCFASDCDCCTLQRYGVDGAEVGEGRGVLRLCPLYICPTRCTSLATPRGASSIVVQGAIRSSPGVVDLAMCHFVGLHNSSPRDYRAPPASCSFPRMFRAEPRGTGCMSHWLSSNTRRG